MTQQTPTTRPLREPTRLPGSERELRRRLAELEAEREELIRQKRRNLLLAGAAISLVVHIGIMWYLSSVVQHQGGWREPQSVYVEFSTVTEEELTELEEAQLDVEAPESLTDLSEIPETDPILNLEVTPPAVELEVGNTGSLATLGGSASGGGSDLTLGGGSADASFFGISSQGTRFCYIVDISGSMSGQSKLRTALRELGRSIQSLPDFAYFYILFFSTDKYQPPWQEGWTRAREREVARLTSWLPSISPGGGTQPLPAFRVAFALEEPPDVIFFLTDGQIPQDTAPKVIAENRSSSGAVINTIAFGDPRSQDQLKQIASQTGGLYRFVKVPEQ